MVHPQRFMVWLAMASIVMLFAGFTSAYIVKQADTNVWKAVAMPSLFWISTGLILISSVTMQLAVRAFHRNRVTTYRQWLAATFVLGAAFLVSQWMAWQQLFAGEDMRIGKLVAADFLYVISGAHFLHVGGGVIALCIMTVLSFFRFRKPEDALMLNLHPDKVPGVELLSTYWHFVDILWIYLFIFFLANA